MSEGTKQKVIVVGAGPVGALAALYAAGRGDEVEVYELRSGRVPVFSSLICAPRLLATPFLFVKTSFPMEFESVLKSNSESRVNLTMSLSVIPLLMYPWTIYITILQMNPTTSPSLSI